MNEVPQKLVATNRKKVLLEFHFFFAVITQSQDLT